MNKLQPASEQDRAIASRIGAGENRGALARELGVSGAAIKGAESRVARAERAVALLAGDPWNIEGLWLSGALHGRIRHHLHLLDRDFVIAPVARLSDVAALGRSFVSRFWTCGGEKSMAEIDRSLEQAGLEWAGDGGAPKRREQEPMRSAAPVQPKPEPSLTGLGYALDCIRDLQARVARLERIFARVIGGDEDDEDDGRDLEAAGNVVCLPGVRLSDVLRDGGRP